MACFKFMLWILLSNATSISIVCITFVIVIREYEMLLKRLHMIKAFFLYVCLNLTV